ncbi:uncharacterized protein LOC119792401 [Cyprinodon tularosa]|uniref:uncharacterized protein LOC119792401 n=1 Tax=Cyprinodon tularosa TaxID=77115 RepID=UPI0018E24B5A|nr:uncharacterized protein LOC119792401 [Cyprinodon tularosa]
MVFNSALSVCGGIGLGTMLSSVLLLLLISGSHAAYYGFVYSYSTKDLQAGGYPTVIRYVYSFSTCAEVDAQACGGNCNNPGIILNKIQEISGEWCQKERIYTRVNYGSQLSPFGFTGGNWTDNRNGIIAFRVEMQDEGRIRSDTGKPNTSPLTTVLPVLRVPSNCKKNFSLLAFDPDGDEVRCRYAKNNLSECDICTPPHVLNLSSSCALAFNPTSSSDEGSYAVQLMMEDFAAQTITVTAGNGVQEVKNLGEVFSKIPVQFVFKVDPAAPSCTEGIYMPKFLPPTPDNGAQISTTINQTLEIPIRAEATQSLITNLLFSGPHNVIRSKSGSGNFTLQWTPSDLQGGLTHPICFVVQANLSGSVYNSDLRCIFVMVANYSTPAVTAIGTTTALTTMFVLPTTTNPPPTTTMVAPTTVIIQPTTIIQPTNTTSSIVSTTNTTPDRGPYYVFALNAKISTTLSLLNDKDTMTQLIKEELVRQGLPSAITVSISEVETAAAP